MLAPEQRGWLERRLEAHERQTGSQVVVVIFPSLEGESLEDVSIRLAQQWKIGQKGRDTGVILLVFVNDRRLRIEVGYGLEGRLTDALADSIIRNEIAPRFREGGYAAGIDAGLSAIFKAIAGEYRPARRPPAGDVLAPAAVLAFFVLVLALMALGAVASRHGRRVGRHGYTGGPAGWYPVGGGGFGGGFGGGGGGFSGGGGSFGGGGASGRW